MSDLKQYLEMLREIDVWSSEDYPRLFTSEFHALLESQAALPSSALWDALAWKVDAPGKLLIPRHASPVARCMALLAQSDAAYPHTVCALLSLQGAVNIATPSRARPGKHDVHTLIPLAPTQNGTYTLGNFESLIVTDHKPRSLKRVDVWHRVQMEVWAAKRSHALKTEGFPHLVLVTVGAMLTSKKHFLLTRKKRIKEGRVGVHFFTKPYSLDFDLSNSGLQLRHRQDKTRPREPWDVLYDGEVLPFGVLDED